MKLSISHPDQLSDTAARLLSEAGSARIFAFQGPMGAGKTTFVKAICRQLGVKGPTSSPTYALVNEYHCLSGEKIFHFDFYRIKTEEEALDMGFRDYLDSGHWCFIEWPEKIASLLPSDCLMVGIEQNGEERCISFPVSA
ncbi:MAG TPA: tRNA (adenosine(37)-N6)-threonylcarbamoyltransferase complex ATPase subunit type 1 TsaE [Bacteroidia bacterium]|jgi:tRNA threonylcarbamoyladenosine biosynthesis protein TsaE|nr:tRNA (adenosine(37)-N6)-threonylcarbamoyltransferase complex ATPase subunit type 1 TsaE [Bacteroidia bacterium]